jgi:hypothetical protein
MAITDYSSAEPKKRVMRRNLRGSHLFNQFCGQGRTETNIAGSTGHDQKRLPSKWALYQLIRNVQR